jgi:hypothetical protein
VYEAYHIQITSRDPASMSNVVNVSINTTLISKEPRIMVVDVPLGDSHSRLECRIDLTQDATKHSSFSGQRDLTVDRFAKNRCEETYQISKLHLYSSQESDIPLLSIRHPTLPERRHLHRNTA